MEKLYPLILAVLPLFRERTKYVLNMSIFWDITPCSPLKVNRRFGGTCRLDLQSRGRSGTKSQHEADSKQNVLGYPEDGDA
jgi:hypothetical protein